MQRWIVRLVRSVLVLLVVAIITCSLARLLPGDPALLLLGQDSTEAQRAELRHALGLDRGTAEYFVAWLGGIARGNWGISFLSGRPVLEEILTRVPATFELVLLAQLLAILIAVPVALYVANRAGGRADTVISGLTFAMMSVPSFVLGLLLILVFAVRLGALPASGFAPLSEGPIENLRTMVLPVLTLALAEVAAYLRTLRGATVEVLGKPYADAALSRGASVHRLLWTRMLRPASPAFVTLVGMTTASSLGGTLLVESVFGVPGLGRLAVSSLASRDLPMIQGTVLFASLVVVIMSVLIDVAVGLVNPRGKRAN